MARLNADHPGFHTVLVGHDGTPAADIALQLAHQLAADDATVLVARVVPTEPLLVRALAHGRDRPDLEQTEAELAGLDLQATAAQRIATRVARGHSVERELIALATEERADLIVVGSDRRPGDHRAHKVLGLRLLQGAPCAVAIAAADGDGTVRRIGVAYDASPEAELALDAAYDLAQRLGAAITLYLAVLPDVASWLEGELTHREAGALLDAAAERAPQGSTPRPWSSPGTRAARS